MALLSSRPLESIDDIPTVPGTIVAGRYRVDRVLGTGPMSVVVAATHLDIDRAVAIKFLNPDSAGRQDAAERFRREAQTAARIKNEHVVRVIDVGTLPGGLPFIVMDLVEGRSLKDELLVRGSLPVSEAVGHVLQAIEALAEAHCAGVVHRDLKPANLFLAERADHSRLVKVLDFGVSKWLDDASSARLALTHTGMVVGSPLYMPPEQLQSSQTVDWRADIWSLGVVLYELLTGHVPFDTDSLPELCAMLLTEAPVPPTKYRSTIPRALEAVILRCLARDRDERYQNVAELAAALVPFAAPEHAAHAERAQRTLVRSTNPASSGVQVAFSAEGARSRITARPTRQALFPRVQTWAGWSLAMGALLGVGFASLEPSPSAKKPPAMAVQRVAAASIPPAGVGAPSVMPTPNASAPIVSVDAPVASESVVRVVPRAATVRRSVPALAAPRNLAAAPPTGASAPTAALGYQLPEFGGRK